MLRSLLPALLLCAPHAPLLADSAFELGPRTVDPLGVANDTLGFSIAALPVASGGARGVAGALGGYVAVLELAAGERSASISQRLQSAQTADSYGLAVGIGGVDGEWLAVGAPADDSFGQNTGRVYVYRRQGNGLYALFDTLDPPAPAVTANYGTAVAISPEGGWLAVGEPKAIVAGEERGAVHVYPLGAGVGAVQTHVGDVGLAARYGQAVALSADRLVVGAPLADDAAMVLDTGAVRVLLLGGAAPLAEGPPLFADDRATEDRLGLAVAIDGDVLVAGAGNDNKPAGGDAGSAYIFRRDGSWQQELKLRSSQPQAQERFGQSVAVSGDGVLVGAYCLNTAGCSGPGAIYSFHFDGTSWSEPQRLSASDAGSLGHAVAFAGPVRLLAGAFSADAAFIDQGAVYAGVIDVLLADSFE